MSASATFANSVGGSSGGAAALPTVMSSIDVDEGATALSTAQPILAVNPGICRYFQRGICRFGSLCRFSHDLSAGKVISGGGIETDSSKAPTPSRSGVKLTTETLHARPGTSRQNWVNAPVFVPKSCRPAYSVEEAADSATNDGATGLCPMTSDSHKSWADVVGGGSVSHRVGPIDGTDTEAMLGMVCPYEGPCPYGIYCVYGIHMELCKMCDQFCLHPTDQTQRRKHNQECLQQHEQAMEWSFAIARSKDKTCGICFDTIMEKAGREKRFGILPNCNHIFCLECIRKWRQAKQFEHKITRSCPECRVSSDFVCPSAFWVETKEEKDKLLTDYRVALGVKDCKYFKKGDGKCPFGNKCFYKHALPNGELVDVGCPKRARKLHRGSNDFIDLLDIYLWEFVEHRDYHWLDFLSGTSDDSDDTDFSEE